MYIANILCAIHKQVATYMIQLNFYFTHMSTALTSSPLKTCNHVILLYSRVHNSNAAALELVGKKI